MLSRDQVAGALVVQAGGDQLLRRSRRRIGGEAADFR